MDNCYHLFVGQNQRITSYKDTVQNMNYYWYAVAKYDEVWLSGMIVSHDPFVQEI